MTADAVTGRVSIHTAVAPVNVARAKVQSPAAAVESSVSSGGERSRR